MTNLLYLFVTLTVIIVTVLVAYTTLWYFNKIYTTTNLRFLTRLAINRNNKFLGPTCLNLLDKYVNKAVTSGVDIQKLTQIKVNVPTTEFNEYGRLVWECVIQPPYTTPIVNWMLLYYLNLYYTQTNRILNDLNPGTIICTVTQDAPATQSTVSPTKPTATPMGVPLDDKPSSSQTYTVGPALKVSHLAPLSSEMWLQHYARPVQNMSSGSDKTWPSGDALQTLDTQGTITMQVRDTSYLG